MKADIQLVGDGSAARGLHGALLKAGLSSSTANGELLTFTSWDSVQALSRSIDGTHAQCLIVEDFGHGAIAFGPSFREDTAGCFRCYIARRRANGGTECRPAKKINDIAGAHIAARLRSLVDGRVRSLDCQIELSDAGVEAAHAFIPVPTCSRCRLRLHSRASSIEALVDSSLGIVHTVRTIRDAPAGFFGFEALGCRTDAFGSPQALNHGFAIDEYEAKARCRAVGESIERYCAALRIAEAPLAFAHELDAPHIPASSFPTSYEDPTARRRRRWIKARRIANDQDVWVPASLVYVPYRDDQDESTGLQTSVGLAAGETVEQAIHSGIAEIIERDSCLRAWRRCLFVERVSASVFDLPGLHLARVPSDTNFEIVVAFLEQDCFPLTATGLAARPSLNEAARHATLEALQSQAWLRNVRYEGCVYSPPRTMADHAFAHAMRRDLVSSRSDWLVPQVTAGSASAIATWPSIVGSIPDACYVTISTPDVEAAGLTVVRTLIPRRVLADDDALMPLIGGLDLPHPFG